MKVVSGEQMRNIDKLAIENLGIPGIVLMENAALSVVGHIIKKVALNKLNEKALIIAGTGNNGGDGFAIARLLYNKGFDVKILLLGDENKIVDDAKINYDIVKKMKLPILKIEGVVEANKEEELIKEYDIIIDSVFGTGLCRNIEDYRADIIEAVNTHGKYRVAVDIPSGVHAYTGQILGIGVKAHLTVTFAMPKVGLLLYPGAEYVGELIVADISIPDIVLKDMDIKINTLDEKQFKDLLPKRKNRSNKGTYGTVLIVAGSTNMTGAAILSAKAAYRTGSGLVNICISEEDANVVQQSIPEAVLTTYTIKDDEIIESDKAKIIKMLKKVSAVVLGPGLSQQNYVTNLVKLMIQNSKVPVVIDADALNVISKNKSILKEAKAPLMITPHPGEMSRLSEKNISLVLDEIIDTAVKFSEIHELICVLKDARTIISNKDGEVYINTHGNSGMATAGAGDVLAGIIGSLVGQGIPPFEASYLGVDIHSKAGDLAEKELGKYSLIASDLCANISKVMKH